MEPTNIQNTDPQVVHMARAFEPPTPQISEDVQKKAAESKALFPNLNLSTGEYVITVVPRHPIGILAIWTVVGSIIVLLFFAIPFIMGSATNGVSPISGGGESLAYIFLILSVLAFLGGVVSTSVYRANRFFLTNECVIQHIQTSLLSKKEQTISLINIEDASFRQHGILQYMFDYGSLRLSTEGDETTYRFIYASHPQLQIKKLDNAIEAFKNGHPFESYNN